MSNRKMLRIICLVKIFHTSREGVFSIYIYIYIYISLYFELFIILGQDKTVRANSVDILCTMQRSKLAVG